MNNREKKAGLVAGISLIIMAIVAGFSYGFVQGELLNEYAEITWKNLIENKTLFLAGLAGWIIIFITDLIVAGALFIFFKNSMRRISALTAIVRIVYTIILGVAIYQLIEIIPFLQGHQTSFEINSQFASFEKIWSVGLIIFGFHLIGLGYLSVKSNVVPKLLAYLLFIAGISYVLIHAAKQFTVFSQNVIESAESILAIPMALSEILLAIWLIYKGLNSSILETK